MEYILDWSIEEDDAEVCQEWETPIVCVWKGDRWIFTQNQINGEFGYMRKEIVLFSLLGFLQRGIDISI